MLGLNTTLDAHRRIIAILLVVALGVLLVAGVAAGCRTLRVQSVDFSLLDAAHSIIAGNAQPAWKAEPSCTSVLSPAKKIISIVP